MAFSITCQCGKKLLAKQAPAPGKRLRCPACHQIVTTAPQVAQPAAPVVFISHSAKDKSTAAAICSTLEGQGVRCWVAPRDIVPGKDWGEAIIEGISGCRIMVLIFSGHSNESPQVRREVERAVNKGLVIIPFRTVDVPMAKSLEYFLSSAHWLDALTTPLDPHIRKLAETVQALLKQPAASTPAPRLQPIAPSISLPPQRRSRSLIWTGAAAAVLLAMAATLFVLWNRQPQESVQAQGAAPKGPGDDKQASSPGVPLPPSEVALREGTLHVRSLRLETNAAPLPAQPGEQPVAPGWLLVSNQKEPGPWSERGPKARLHFQITNNTYEAPTLASVELALLGVVDLYEDYIDPPQPPSVLKTIASREVKFGRARTLTDFPNASELFKDYNDPPSPLRYEATSDMPEIASPKLDAQHRLELFLPGDTLGVVKSTGRWGGTAKINLRALNAFDLASATSFDVKTAPKPPRALKPPPPREVEISGPTTLENVADATTLFEDGDNDPRSPLKFGVSVVPSDAAKATLDDQQRVKVALSGKHDGEVAIILSATNKYDQSASLSFSIKVKLKVKGKNGPQAVQQAAIPPNFGLPQTFKPPINTTTPANVPLSIPAFEVAKETLRLTNVRFAHALKRNEVLKPSLSGNLVPADAKTSLRVNSAVRLTVDLQCPTSWEFPADSPKDLLVGDRERKLAARAPQFLGTCHLLAIVVEVIAEDGKRHHVYGDRIYALYSSPILADPTGKPGVPQTFLTSVIRGEEKDLQEALAPLLKWCVKPHAETVAFERAKVCGAVPAKFDPLAVSPACFYGDRASPFRQAGAALPATAPAEAWPRNNVVRVLDQARTAHPRLGKELEASLAKLSADADVAGARRAAYVAEQLRSLPPRPADQK